MIDFEWVVVYGYSQADSVDKVVVSDHLNELDDTYNYWESEIHYGTHFTLKNYEVHDLGHVAAVYSGALVLNGDFIYLLFRIPYMFCSILESVNVVGT
ncbi:hypothetical protein DGG96_03680 [Legionella qingyii]|uniref:Uncharacterized protein n=1 Tax=Legionella qingyii TaxID=2184757 RepID=A0A317U6J2_9GAMM|nr:hypothetical protein DGG96_03680 [Legionella qingyii]